MRSPVLLITHMIIDWIGVHSVLLPLVTDTFLKIYINWVPLNDSSYFPQKSTIILEGKHGNWESQKSSERLQNSLKNLYNNQFLKDKSWKSQDIYLAPLTQNKLACARLPSPGRLYTTQLLYVCACMLTKVFFQNCYSLYIILYHNFTE